MRNDFGKQKLHSLALEMHLFGSGVLTYGFNRGTWEIVTGDVCSSDQPGLRRAL